MMFIAETVISLFILSCLGSFIGVCVDRIPSGESIVRGRSRCSKCHSTLYFYELIPIISFLSSKGKCRHCRASIPVHCLLIEFATIAIGLLPLLHYGYSLTGILFALTACILLTAAVLDYKTLEIPDTIHVMIALLGIINMICTRTYIDSIIGLFIISLPFFILSLFGAMGLADAKLMGAAGLLLGWQFALLATFLGILFGFVYAVIQKLSRRRNWKSEIAFGPFLCLGIYLAILFGNYMLNFYVSFF